MYTVRFQLELSGSEKRFLSKSFRIMKPGRKVFPSLTVEKVKSA